MGQHCISLLNEFILHVLQAVVAARGSLVVLSNKKKTDIPRPTYTFNTSLFLLLL